MIVAVDTTVLLDVFIADPHFGPRSREALRSAISRGRVIACDVVWAETAACFPSVDDSRTALSQLGVEFVPMNEGAAAIAGRAWKDYRKRGGKRERVIADFLIGAHAREQAEQLLTRDRGFYRLYFRGLAVVDPSA